MNEVCTLQTVPNPPRAIISNSSNASLYFSIFEIGILVSWLKNKKAISSRIRIIY